MNADITTCYVKTSEYGMSIFIILVGAMNVSTGTYQKIYFSGSIPGKKGVRNKIFCISAFQFFNHPEGYVKINNSGSSSGVEMNYVYQYKDHLGNIRLSYADTNNDGSIDAATEIIEEKNYYPFGMLQKGYNNVVTSNGNSTAQKYGFTGKEHQDELGLGWIDITARNYDATLGRWMNLDPLAEKFYAISSYNYVANSPMLLSDPDGRDISFSVKRNDDGEITGITITVTGKIINNSSKKLSKKDLEKRRDRILKGLSKIKVTGAEGIDVSFKGNIDVAESESDIEKDDHVFRLVDDISKIKGIKAGANAVGAAPIGQNVIYLKNNFSANTAAHEFGHSSGFKHINESRQSDFMPETVKYFRSLLRNPYGNEVNHYQAGSYLRQVYGKIYNNKSFPGNLMHRGVIKNSSGSLINNPNRGYKVTMDQVRTIMYNIENGKINKGQQK